MNTGKVLLLCLLMATPAVLFAEDQAPKVEAPKAEAPKSEADPKAETPADGGEKIDPAKLKELIEKDAKEQAILDDPKSIIGPPPTFPLKQDIFSSIEDDDEHLSNNIDRKTGEMELDLFPMEAMLHALRASTQEHLEANIAKDVTYDDLMRNPDKYRGQVVRLTGILQQVGDNGIFTNTAGVKKLWRGYVSNGQNNIITFRSLEPLPPELEKGRNVELVGIFLQRYAYLNRYPGEKVTWAPMLFCRTLKPHKVIQPAGPNPMNSPLAIIVFVVLSILAVFYCYNRSKLKGGGIIPNKFSRMKAERAGPESVNFPTPGAPKKNFPGGKKTNFPQPGAKPPEKA
jgi:hypothetical protein